MIEQEFPRYLSLLRQLVELRSVFSEPQQVCRAAEHVADLFRNNLPNFQVYQDSAKNIIALPNDIDLQKDIVYLSAHIDTVDALAEEWQAPYQPYSVFEDEQQMVGRGVNDCKAGVAFQLLLSELAGKNAVSLKNCVFTITFKEEGPGEKTSQAIARAIGDSLPLSNAETYLLVLENNVKVGSPAVLNVYPQERSSFSISVDGSAGQLREMLKRLPQWSPVAVQPIKPHQAKFEERFTQQGGHICSMPREKNLLTKILLQAADTTVLAAGNLEQFAVVPTNIEQGTAATPTSHRLVLTNRSFDSREDVEQQLSGIEHTKLKDFSISAGLSQRDRFLASPLAQMFEQSATQTINVNITSNVGTSDASIIYNSLPKELRPRILPVVAGPGCMSQRQADPPRLTHGVNETFDKAAGKAAIQLLFSVLKQLGAVNDKSCRQ